MSGVKFIGILDVAAGRCLCGTCQRLDRRYPREGWQLRLPIAPDHAASDHPDTPAAVTAGVSQHQETISHA